MIKHIEWPLARLTELQEQYRPYQLKALEELNFCYGRYDTSGFFAFRLWRKIYGV